MEWGVIVSRGSISKRVTLYVELLLPVKLPLLLLSIEMVCSIHPSFHPSQIVGYLT